ncbi:uncharacterized protein LOC127227039 [Phodopus roborovskii]|uniref:uncharacterized protein LOC127227039 n=1 Tax=Phodopus roborovskii TaxID=109678 RepID=UPI0021E4E7A5|nr:uncharacterized protein LOC127227039 [Phodopus roborovskii]
MATCPEDQSDPLWIPERLTRRVPASEDGKAHKQSDASDADDHVDDHWSKVQGRAQNKSVDLKKKRWQNLCASKWPTFNVGWTQDGTFDLGIILQVKERVFDTEPHRHPDQVAYIVTWEDMASDPPPWPPSQGTEGGGDDQQRDPDKPDSTTPALDNRQEETAADSPVAGRLCGRREPAMEVSSQTFPLRQTAGQGGQFQYWPFSASDLYNWKSNNPSFSKDPVALSNLIESNLINSLGMIANSFCTSEEKQRVFLEAWKNVLGDNRRSTQLPNEIEEVFPLNRPDWDFNIAAGRGHLHLYRLLLIAGLRGAGHCSNNLAQVTQGLEETLTAFLERLKEAYHMYTPFDPDSNEQRGNVSMAFIWQSAPDIRIKLQRLDNLQDYSLQDLAKESEKNFNKRETPEEKKEGLRKLFKNSPTLFDEALHQDLADFWIRHPSLILLQYVDDLLLAATTKQDCKAGFCRLWILGFAEIAPPLYLLTKQDTPFDWTEEQQQAFDAIKRALLSSPALGLPDVTKPFELFVDEKQGYAKGALTQKLGPWRWPIAYFSKKLDPVASG